MEQQRSQALYRFSLLLLLMLDSAVTDRGYSCYSACHLNP